MEANNKYMGGLSNNFEGTNFINENKKEQNKRKYFEFSSSMKTNQIPSIFEIISSIKGSLFINNIFLKELMSRIMDFLFNFNKIDKLKLSNFKCSEVFSSLHWYLKELRDISDLKDQNLQKYKLSIITQNLDELMRSNLCEQCQANPIIEEKTSQDKNLLIKDNLSVVKELPIRNVHNCLINQEYSKEIKIKKNSKYELPFINRCQTNNSIKPQSTITDLNDYIKDCRKKNKLVNPLYFDRSEVNNNINSLKIITPETLENTWLKERNKQIQEKKLKESLLQNMINFGNLKSRFNENLLRKRDTLVEGGRMISRDYGQKKISSIEYNLDSNQKLSKVDFLSKDSKKICKNNLSKLPDFEQVKVNEPLNTVNIESVVINHKPKLSYDMIYTLNDRHLKKINSIRHIKGDFIKRKSNNTGSQENLCINPLQSQNLISLSAFQKDRTQKIKENEILREFPMIDKKCMDKRSEQENEELKKMKFSLDRFSIPCSLTTLKRAIISPDGYELNLMKKQNFLTPGTRLIKNIFLKMKRCRRKHKKHHRRKNKVHTSLFKK